MEKAIYLLKGITGAGKSTYARKLSEETGAIIVSTDEIRKANNMSVTCKEAIPKQKIMVEEYLKIGKSVIVDGTNLKQGADNYYNQLGRVYNAKVVLIYFAIHPIKWNENILKRGNDRDEFIKIRSTMYGALTLTGLERFNEVKLIVNDYMNPIEDFQEFYKENKDLFLKSPREFIKLVNSTYGNVFEEFNNCIGYDQQNYNHIQTLDEHILSVTEYLKEQGEIMMWAGIIHDLGKIVEGIKEIDEDTGNASYLGHAGASTDIGICLLTRFGFNKDFIMNVIQIVNRHMYIPYVGKLSKSKKNSLGLNMYEKLLIFRKADKESKKTAE